MHHPTDRIAHTTAFVTPVVEHWLEQNILKQGMHVIYTCYEQQNVKDNDMEKKVILVKKTNNYYLILLGYT